MNLSTPTSPKPREPLSILLLGAPGSRKTTFALQFPGVYVIDTDGNLAGPETTIRHGIKDIKTGKLLVSPLDPNLSYSWDSANFTSVGDGPKLEVPMAMRYDRVKDLLTASRNLDCQTVFVDSFTMIDHFIITKILKAQSRDELKPNDYQVVKSNYWELLTKLKGTGKVFIATCHEIPMYEPSPSNMMKEVLVGYEPSLSGKVRHFLGAFFTDIWRCAIEPEATAAGVVMKAKLYTSKTTKSPDLKNSLGLPAVMDATYSEIKKYIV
jgi:hypothetical protein